MIRAAGLMLGLVASAVAPATAQVTDAEVLPCEGWQASVGNLIEPLEATTRSFAEGRIRVLLLGHGEPACCGTWIAVLHPTPEGFPSCALILRPGRQGWADAGFDGESTYDPATGLSVPITVRAYDPSGTSPEVGRLTLTVDQGRGRVTVD